MATYPGAKSWGSLAQADMWLGQELPQKDSADLTPNHSQSALLTTGPAEHLCRPHGCPEVHWVPMEGLCLWCRVSRSCSKSGAAIQAAFEVTKGKEPRDGCRLGETGSQAKP